MKILGIDLAGKDGNPTGFCLILGDIVLSIGIFRTLKALLEYLNILRPSLVAIDAPLSFPSNKHFRDCDLLLKRFRLSPLPINMPSMAALVRRAITITRFLDSMGIKYIETFPAGSIRFLGFKRKPRSHSERAKFFRKILKMFGLASNIDYSRLTKDEFDAFICAISGYAYVHQRYFAFKGNECTIILPCLEDD